MKYLSFLPLFLSSSVAFAGPQWVNVPPMSPNLPNMGSSSNSNPFAGLTNYYQQKLEEERYERELQQQSYESNSGSYYEYDLNNDSDSLRYSIDSDAQIRDSMNYSPSVEMDRRNGEYGGGYID